jgi:hypothetical protein
LGPLEYARLVDAIFNGVRAIARLHRDHLTLAGAAGQAEWDQIMGLALDELSAEWGVDL